MFVCFFLLWQGVAGEVGAVGATGPRVSSLVLLFTVSTCESCGLFRFIHLCLVILCNKKSCLTLPFGCPYREKEAHQEKEVKLGPMGSRDPKVVRVEQDQMGQRYQFNKTVKRFTLKTVTFVSGDISWCTSRISGQPRSKGSWWRARRCRTSGDARGERHTRTLRAKGRCCKSRDIRSSAKKQTPVFFLCLCTYQKQFPAHGN